ncbi:MAG: hypothetical protein K2I88_03100 [Anaeroplasmataceae bacterium]|nr:hypothetical protein [Anaeroplasmataceae bacterium]
MNKLMVESSNKKNEKWGHLPHLQCLKICVIIGLDVSLLKEETMNKAHASKETRRCVMEAN